MQDKGEQIIKKKCLVKKQKQHIKYAGDMILKLLHNYRSRWHSIDFLPMAETLEPKRYSV